MTSEFANVLSEDLRKDKRPEAQLEYYQRLARADERQQNWPYYMADMRRINELEAEIAQARTDDQLILEAAAAEYGADMVELGGVTFTLRDGHIARYVKVFMEQESDDGFIDRVPYDEACFYATVVEGEVFSNEKLSDLRFEYASIYDLYDIFASAS